MKNKWRFVLIAIDAVYILAAVFIFTVTLPSMTIPDGSFITVFIDVPILLIGVILAFKTISTFDAKRRFHTAVTSYYPQLRVAILVLTVLLIIAVVYTVFMYYFT